MMNVRMSQLVTGMVALMGLLGAGACRVRQSPPPAGIEGIGMTVETVYKSVHSGVSEADTRVIRNGEEARRYFEQLMAHRPEDKEPPAVDYRRWMLLAVGLGSRRNGGYSVEITAVRRQEDTLTVDYVETEPGPACIVSQVITHPVHVVKIPAFEGEVLFRGSKVVDDCR